MKGFNFLLSKLSKLYTFFVYSHIYTNRCELVFVAVGALDKEAHGGIWDDLIVGGAV